MPTKAELYVPASLFSVENPLREASAKVAGYMVRNRISRVGICLEPGWQAVEALLGCVCTPEYRQVCSACAGPERQ